MGYKGSAVYDNEEFNRNYIARRNRKESPNNIMEYPALMRFIGDVKGSEILDLGCGDGLFGLDLLEAGCKGYEAVDGSDKMVEAARENLSNESASIHHAPLENWNFPTNRYDLITSRLVFHYIEDLSGIFERIYQALRADGRFIFSVQHPVLTASKHEALEGKRTSWNVDHYFDLDGRVEKWIDKEVVKYHRTIEEYFRLLTEAGFQIKNLSECPPERENFKTEEEFERRKRIPLFLLFSCCLENIR
ncbi:biotin biosynthesis protein BioC [Oceanobacillus picturae]|uniref:Biotin biosynthesis protein BioC n=1 Tax=Oceanobacillus picturae TaxID=171693 RepID=A0A0U9H697_9BACI|nr:class I SAM-dependent methyltransferase [Oceanobacillus picturae]GAQ17273.1 biotin biosynthesis protein BioC [Oceanobacillus picturae]